MTDKNIEIHYHSSGDWAALYVDGKFESQGHESSVRDDALGLLGVKQVYDNAFMRGDNSGHSTAKTIDDIKEYTEERDRARLKAMALRAQAAKLIAEAASLENKH